MTGGHRQPVRVSSLSHGSNVTPEGGDVGREVPRAPRPPWGVHAG